MPYLKDRLHEALEVIREDNRRRHELEVKKLAETQYRDGFHLRRSTAANNNAMQVWRGDDDTSDDEYAPGSKKRGRRSTLNIDLEEEGRCKKDKGKRKRRSYIPRPIDDGQEYCEEQPRPKKQKTNDEEIVLSPTHGFLSLRIVGEVARERFLELTKKTKTANDSSISLISDEDEHQTAGPSQWRLSSGGLHRTQKSTAEQKQDHDVTILVSNLELDDEGTNKKPRTLRSGKVRKPVTPRKRKQHDVDFEFASETEVTPKKSKCIPTCSIDTINPYETPMKQIIHSKGPDIPSGRSLEDAIAIEDSSSDENTPITPSQSSRKSNSSSTQHTSPFVSPHHSPDTIQATFKTEPHSHSPAPSPTQASTQLVLTTQYSHPINFKTTTSRTCTFHNDYRHSLLGHPARTSTYIIYRDQPSQLIELPAEDHIHTHHNTNPSPDAMCVPCALAYLQITRCSKHSFTPYRQPAHARELLAQGTEIATRTLVQDIWTGFKRDDPRRNTTAPPLDLCSLCLAPAKYRCCEPQGWDMLKRPCRLPGESVEDALRRINNGNGDGKMVVKQVQPPMLGCGLKLCGKCVVLVRDRCGGRMQENRALVLKEAHKQPLGARADVEFLFREGLVWKAYHADKG